MSDGSADSIRSPLRAPQLKTSNLGEDERTLAVDADDLQSKGSYEMARDKRVAQLKQMFRPVEESAETLYVLSLSSLPSCSFH